MTKQFIICSAIWYNDGKDRVHNPKNIPTGIVVCGRRHHNCYRILAELFPDWRYKTNQIEGFMTSDDMFVSRELGFKIAKEANQLIAPSHTEVLYSEDLY